MSARTEAFKKIMDFLHNPDNRMSEVYGCIEGISKDKKYRYSTFCHARTLDGEVRVYGPKYIMVRWQTAYRNLPHEDTLVFDSADNAVKFLRLAFVEHDRDAALEVQTRGEK